MPSRSKTNAANSYTIMPVSKNDPFGLVGDYRSARPPPYDVFHRGGLCPEASAEARKNERTTSKHSARQHDNRLETSAFRTGITADSPIARLSAKGVKRLLQ